MARTNRKRILPVLMAATMLLSATQLSAAAVQKDASAQRGKMSSSQKQGSNAENGKQHSSKSTSTNSTYNVNTTVDGVSTVSGNSKSKASKFTDVSANDWFYSSVQQMQRSGIMNGNGNGRFSPKASVSRGMFITIFGRLLSVDTSKYTDYGFSDVSSDKYYSGYVAWATADKLFDGVFEDQTFQANAAISRAQICDIIYRYLVSEGKNVTSSDITGFKDYSAIKEGSRDAVAAMVGEGIMTGSKSNVFQPNKSCSRAELAAILQRLAKALDINLDDLTNSQNGTSTTAVSLSGVLEVNGENKTSSGTTIASSTADQSAVVVKNDGTLTISGSTITKTGDTSNTTYSNQYGVNSVVAATTSSKIKISDSTLSSTAKGSSAIFVSGRGSAADASGVTISTIGEASRGLAATSGGTITANGVKITTEGKESPVLYSSGSITATDVTGTANHAQAAIIKGAGSITLKNSTLYGNSTYGISSAVILYQDNSGEAVTGTGKFSTNGGTLGTTNENASMFYVTNTDSIISLTNTKLDFRSGLLVYCAGNTISGWGTTGKNGGDLTLSAHDKQALSGKIVCDETSSVKLNLNDSSTFNGAIDSDNKGNCRLRLSANAAMSLTGNCYLTSFDAEDQDYSNISFNGFKIYVDGKSIN